MPTPEPTLLPESIEPLPVVVVPAVPVPPVVVLPVVPVVPVVPVLPVVVLPVVPLPEVVLPEVVLPELPLPPEPLPPEPDCADISAAEPITIERASAPAPTLFNRTCFFIKSPLFASGLLRREDYLKLILPQKPDMYAYLQPQKILNLQMRLRIAAIFFVFNYH